MNLVEVIARSFATKQSLRRGVSEIATPSARNDKKGKEQSL